MTTELNQEIKPLTAEDIEGIRDRWTEKVKGIAVKPIPADIRRLIETIEAKDAMLAAIGKSHADTCDLAAKLSDERDTYAEQLAGTLALLAETRRALGSRPCPECRTENFGRPCLECARLATLTTPEAFRKQEDMRRIAAAALKVATWKWICPHSLAVQSGGVCRQCQDLRDLESALFPLMDTEPKGGQA